MAKAFTLGVEAAYQAVMKPTEGTILTVSRRIAEAATQAAARDSDPVAVLDQAMTAGWKALEETPELLPVLKKAGVVDAGGQGYLVILEGMVSVFKDGKIIESGEVGPEVRTDRTTFSSQREEDITFTYCTEFIVDKKAGLQKDAKGLRAYLETIGDSVVVVDDDSIIKVHVHTDNPGNALQKALQYGGLTNMKIENMRKQFETQKKQERTENKAKEGTYARPEEEYGFVSVCIGSGVEELFVNLGVNQIVSGGQTMNPSTDDILTAIHSTPAKTVFVLPNNKNIIMAAEQAIRLADRRVVVLHTRTIPQGISAMMAFDPEADVEKNTIEMSKAAERVGTGQVTFAARDSDFDGHKIKEGEILGLENGKLSFIEKDAGKAVLRLIKSLTKKTASYIILIHGEDVLPEEAQRVADQVIAKVANDVEVVLVNGGQPIYYYIISVE